MGKVVLDETVVLTWDKSYWLATTENPPIHGIGGTPDAATKDYFDSLHELEADLAEHPDCRLSEYWKDVKKLLGLTR